MAAEQMRGLYPIIVTPFDKDYQVDVKSLRNLVEYQIQAGAHGIGVANGSEVLKLTERERAELTRGIVDQTKGRVPVVVSTSGSGTQTAICYSRAAEENGADGLIMMPPVSMGMGSAATPQGLRDFFGQIADAVSVPIFVQSAGSVPVSPVLCLEVCREHPNLCYIKEESMPATARIADAVNKVGDEITVFGGSGGRFFVEEMRRGSQGTMPGCTQNEAFRQVWDLYHAGDIAGAQEVHAKIMRLLSHTPKLRDGFFHIHKELLRQRGVIATANIRPPFHPWPEDEFLRGEVQEAIDEYLAWYP